MNRNKLQEAINRLFGKTNASRIDASRTFRARKLGLESLESRQMLCASGLDAIALCAAPEADSVASVCSGCKALDIAEVDPVVEEAASFTNTMNELLKESGQNPDALTEDFIFNLSSNPNSTYTIYLDFNGNVAKNTYWNSGNDVTTPAYDTDGNGSSFSNSELRDIYEVWLRVSEDYMPFNVNVTTKEPSAADLAKTSNGDTSYGVRVAIGGSCYDWYNSSCGGVAYVGSFTWSSDTPCFVFPKQLYTAKNVAEAVAHEVGHTLTLSHDGNSSQGYYGGADGWAPIMGVGYSQPLTQWSKGEYNDANNHEDDLEKITSNGFDYRADDHGDSIETATNLTFKATGELGSGIIERNTDYDYFSFTLNGEQSVITVGGYTSVTNLDVKVSVYDSAKNLVATYDPSNTYYVSFDVSDFAPGKYYMSVTGTGLTVDGNVIYTDYASLGAYTISTELSSESNDPYEPNDTKVGAYRLGVIDEETTLAAMIDPRSDNDYFNFSIGSNYTGVRITIDYEYAQSSTVLRTTFTQPNGKSTTFSDGSQTFYALASDDSLYLRVNAGSYRNAISYKLTITPLTSPELSGVSLSGKAKIGLPITATLPYDGLTAKYQWYRGTSADDMTLIPGATDATYVPTSDDLGMRLQVVATGYGNCYGTVSTISEPVAAQTVWTVGSTADSASSSPLTLRQALSSADPGDKIVFDSSLNGQTITVGSTLKVDKAITIDASALADSITLDGAGSVRLMESSSSYLCVKGLTFANGSADSNGAGLKFSGSILDVENCAFTGNVVNSTSSDAVYGAAIAVESGKATINKSIFTNNTLTASSNQSGGAAIGASASAETTVSYSTFTGNTSAKTGGAIRAFGELVVENSSFTNNTAQGIGGGAIYADEPITVVNTLMASNTAGNYGGGLYGVKGFEAYNCTIANNSTTYFGGGLYVETGAGYVYNSIVLQNSAQRASGADLEKAAGAQLYGYSNLTSYTKWTEAQNNKTYSATKALFTDAENGDYSLTSDSQAVDVGDNQFVFTSRDITGNTRVYNSTVDLGAYEYMLAPKANLLFSAPTGWDLAVMVVANPTDMRAAKSYKIGENYYVRFAFKNDSAVDIANSFVARVFVDDAVVKTYSISSLAADGVLDYTLDLGALDAGLHTLRVTVDSGNSVEESNENDNVFETSFKVIDDDDYESNDEFDAATDLGVLVAQTTVSAKSGAEQNEDWFRFSTTTLGTAESYVHMSYDYAAESSDLAMYLYDASGNLLTSSVSGNANGEEISLNALAAGTYYLRVVNNVDTSASIPYELTLQPPAPPKPDLTQATPEGWTSPIVVNTSSDATTQAAAYFENQTYFANFNVTNASPTPVSDAFYVEVYLDDALLQTYTVKSISGNGVKSYSVELDKLTVGAHMIKVVVDSTDAIKEESETNNTFTQRFVVAGIDDAYEPNDVRETAYNIGALVETQTFSLYAGSSSNEDWFRFSLPEEGTSAGRIVATYEHVSGQADVDLYLYDEQGNEIAYSNRATGSEMISLNKLAAGVYYVKAYNCSNVQSSVPYELTFYPATVAKPNLAPTAMSTWTDSILVANSASSTTDAETFFSGMNYYVRFAFTNNSSSAVDKAFTVKCYVDDALAKTYEVSSLMVGSNRSYSFGLGVLEMGAHTIRVELDSENTVEESNELDNVYAKTILVVSGDDEFEPNDSFETARDLGVIAGSGYKFSLNAGGGQEEDWFKFTTVATGSANDGATLTYAHVASSADVDLYLYDAQGVEFQASKLSTGAESVSFEGLPEGTYYLMAVNYFDKTLTVPYTLTIDAPRRRTDTPDLTAGESTPTTISVKIGEADSATSYTLQYSLNEDFSNATEVVYSKAGTHEITGLKPETQYYFRAKASSEAHPDSAWSSTVSIATESRIKLAPPTLTASAANATSIAVSVGEVENASRYLFEYSTDPNFSTSTPIYVTAGDFSVINLAPCGTYYLRAKVIADAEGYANSNWSKASVELTATKLSNPNVSYTVKGSDLQLTWDAVEGALRYIVEYKTADETAYTTVSGLTSTSYAIKNIEVGTIYNARVKAVADKTVAINSDWTKLTIRTQAPVKLPTPVVTASSTENSVALSWTPVEGALRYLVQYRAETESSFKTVVVRDATDYALKGLNDGVNYLVKVKAVGDNLDYANSDWASMKVGTPTGLDVLVAPNPTVKTTGNSITLKWEPVEGALRYLIGYRKQGATDWTTITNVTEVEQTIVCLQPGETYELRVKSIANGVDATNSNWRKLTVTTSADGVEETLDDEALFETLALSILN